MDVNCLLFDDFETLDLFGPVEVFGCVKMWGCPEEYAIKFFSMDGGIVTSSQSVPVVTLPFAAAEPGGLVLIPGGRGTRKLADDGGFLEKLGAVAEKARWCLSVCTGSALLASAGLLDGRAATSNKMAFEWVKSRGPGVNWAYRARWAVDGKYYTSSGVSAGIDMSLGFIADRFGRELAEKAAKGLEYVWNDDPDNDPFALEEFA